MILSGFADEGPVSKRAEEQFTMMRALGLSYYTIRFVDLGNGIKNVMQLTKTEVKQLLKLHKEFGMSV
ncbi:MAG: sugar phosphate isomerase/epimerase, partial [bacterium]|nr:sugar phosphate isomerase/epimerase [bacterium]